MRQYHLRKIKKGILGQWSKVKEEYEEYEDALFQKCKIMALLELSDLYGAVTTYVKENDLLNYLDGPGMTKIKAKSLKDLIIFEPSKEKVIDVCITIFYFISVEASKLSSSMGDIIRMSEITERSFRNENRLRTFI